MPLATQLWQRLAACEAARDRRVAELLTPMGLTPAQARLVACLHGGPRGLGELARALGVAPGNVTLVVANLARSGLVERLRDGRSARARLTCAGEDVATSVATRLAALDGELAGRLTEVEQEFLVKLLIKLDVEMARLP